jgi:hypothetical protein
MKNISCDSLRCRRNSLSGILTRCSPTAMMMRAVRNHASVFEPYRPILKYT